MRANLIGEMAKRSISINDIAALLGIHRNSVSNKLYLVLLYWDTEMFRRSTSKRKELEKDAQPKDYRAMCQDLLFLNTDKYTIAPDTKKLLKHWRTLFIKTYGVAQQSHYKKMYEGILYGDPKSRILRILWTSIYNDYNS